MEVEKLAHSKTVESVHRIKGLVEINEERVALLPFCPEGLDLIQMISALVAGKAAVLNF